MHTQYEINGDNIRGIMRRFRYLGLNFWRNLAQPKKLSSQKFSSSELISDLTSVGTWSPGRGLAEAYVDFYLPKILSTRWGGDQANISILDIGCGSGRSVTLFEGAGLSGTWVGTDIDDRHEPQDSSSFETSFQKQDILKAEISPDFNLVYTNSALEHIPSDPDFPKKISGWLKPNGLQLHIVPAPSSLFLYLWHGWRQYSLARIEREFAGHDIAVYPIGGLFSTVLHFLFITFWENILRISIRKKFSNTYRWLLLHAIKADRRAPIFPVFYAVIVSKTAPDETQNNKVV